MTGAIIAIVIIVILIAAALTFGRGRVLRGPTVRHRFGPEYDRLAREIGPRRAQAELAARERRVAELDIRPLTAEQRIQYNREWTAAQERFVQSPAEATQAAAQLVVDVARQRGYPVDDDAQLLADLSVHHAHRLDGYRSARQLTGRDATAPTEELRQALLACRALFLELVGDAPLDRGARRRALRADATEDTELVPTGADSQTQPTTKESQR
jgi:hypothetical protein